MYLYICANCMSLWRYLSLGNPFHSILALDQNTCDSVFGFPLHTSCCMVAMTTTDSSYRSLKIERNDTDSPWTYCGTLFIFIKKLQFIRISRLKFANFKNISRINPKQIILKRIYSLFAQPSEKWEMAAQQGLAALQRLAFLPYFSPSDQFLMNMAPFQDRD